ncbi:hypothetical protein J6590_035533, partial [Homalodisca vitripennis]
PLVFDKHDKAPRSRKMVRTSFPVVFHDVTVTLIGCSGLGKGARHHGKLSYTRRLPTSWQQIKMSPPLPTGYGRVLGGGGGCEKVEEVGFVSSTPVANLVSRSLISVSFLQRRKISETAKHCFLWAKVPSCS